MAVSDTEGIGGIQFLRHFLIGDMQKTLEHTGYLLLGRMTVTGNRHLDLHRRVLIDRYILAQSRSDGNTLCMHDLDHRLRVLIHKLSLDSKGRRMILIYQVLQKEKFFLKTRILSFQFMHIVRAELQNLHLLSDGMQESVTHAQSTRIDT